MFGRDELRERGIEARDIEEMWVKSRVGKWNMFLMVGDQFPSLDCKSLQYTIIKFSHHILFSFIFFF
jgi:hypothetical protein